MNVVRRVLSALRDGWLMLGIVVVMLVALEATYRGQAALRRALRGAGAATPGPYADSTWFPDYMEEYERSFRLGWKPYVYFRRPPLSGRYINVDSAGHRRTLPDPRPARDTMRVFVFGGSTLWGTYQRDASTIPSVLAQRLVALGDSSRAFEVTNFGESGYVSTQELVELQLQLRAGQRPDVVVFYDGINDVAAAVQSGTAGIPQNEANRVREFDFGRAITGTETGVGSDVRAAGAIATAISQRFQFVQRLRVGVGRRPEPARTAARLAADVAAVYAGNVAFVEALGRTFGFTPVYVWQPTLHATRKPLTSFERTLMAEVTSDGFQRRLSDVHRLTPPMLDSLIAPKVGSRFINAASLFTTDSSSVFMDVIGHNTERAIPAIVDSFLPPIRSAIDSLRRSTRAACGAARRELCR